MRSALDLAVVGAGAMGRNHVRVAMGHRDVRVAFVVDVEPTRGQAVAERAGAAYLREIDGLIGNVDAAIVAVPTENHLEVGQALLAAEIHTLIEKPLANTSSDASELVQASEKSGTILMAGHVERFNPAVLALPRILSDPIHIEMTRISPYTPRVVDGVIMDLMIHDLDILRSLVPVPINSIKALSRQVHTDADDLAIAIIEFANGTSASLMASRLGQQKERHIAVTQAANVVRVDLIRQDITIHSQQRVTFDESGSGFRSSGMVESPFIPNRGEPLAIELDHFVSCVINRSKPMVSGDDGVNAIALARDVEQAARLGQ